MPAKPKPTCDCEDQIANLAELVQLLSEKLEAYEKETREKLTAVRLAVGI